MQAFDRAIAANAGHFRAHYLRAIQLERLDRPGDADAAYRRCIDIEPRYSPCFVSLGNLYIGHGFEDLGLTVLELGTEINAGDNEMWVALGRAFLALDRPLDAVRAYGRAKEIEPEHTDALFGLGMAHAALFNHE